MTQNSDELWALVKFRLVALGSDERIEAAIEKMVENWRREIDPSGESCDDFRTKLFALVREGLAEDRVGYYERRRH